MAKTTQKTTKAMKLATIILAVVSGLTLWYPLYLVVLADLDAVSVVVNQFSARLLGRRLQRSNLQRGGGVSDRAVQGMLTPCPIYFLAELAQGRNKISLWVDRPGMLLNAYIVVSLRTGACLVCALAMRN